MTDEWKINILRGKREDEFRHDSYAIVRRKCYDYITALYTCVKCKLLKLRNLIEEGEVWGAFNC